MKKTLEIKPKGAYGCEFCNRTFVKESTVISHLCENKKRWQDLSLPSSRIAFHAWQHFYNTHVFTKKQLTTLDFIKSSYYKGFMKFGNYCVDARVLKPQYYLEWLLKNKVELDSWVTDSSYNNFLVQYLRKEDHFDAVNRSISIAAELAKKENMTGPDYFRLGSHYKICHHITRGDFSPWLLYQSNSGKKFLESLSEHDLKYIFDYIDPDLWSLKFHNDPAAVKEVKEQLHAEGY
jgi:hypothetical protein